MFTIRPMASEEADQVAALIFDSTNAWYENRGLGRIFSGSPSDCLVFPETYEDLDPGCCLVAIEDESGEIIASCFYHPRETHLALGIMNAHPERARGGVAKALLREIMRLAEEAGKPLRLVSSAFNLDSFSLYTRQGLAPYAFYQDMSLPVPAEGIEFPPAQGVTIREARLEDVEAIDALERGIWETSRAGDWRYFIENARGHWHVSVAEAADGSILGVLGSVYHPGSNMLGPGLSRDALTAAALVVAELNQHRGRSPVFLVPSDRADLVALMYQLGARNCELHVAQCLGEPPRVSGIVMPTFLPETA